MHRETDKDIMKIQGWTAQIVFFTLALTFVYMFAAQDTYAQERYEFYNGVRQMGMGGAVIAVVNDETALLSNPAALGKLRDHFITLFDPEIEGNMNVERTVGYEVHRGTDPQFVLDKLNENKGKPLHLKAQMFPSLIFPNFGVGLHTKYVVDAEVDQAGTAYKYNYLNDWSAVAGFNFRLFEGMLKLGGNIRYTNRSEIKRDDIDPTSTNLSVNSLASEGVGVGSDVGMILTAPIKFLPTLAVVWRDAGDTSYHYASGMFSSTASRPETVKNTLDVALAMFPIHANRFRSSWTVELRDILTEDAANEPLMTRFHGGFELNYADALFLRGGANQKYWTAGLELAMFNYQFQLATYGEEIGTVATPREDRRYVLKFSYRF